MGIAVPSQLFGRQHLILSTMKAFAADHLAAKSLHYGAYGAYGGYGLPLAGHLWKRDAEAKPEADAWYGYGGLYGGYGLGYAAAPVVAAPAIPLCINGVAPLGHGLCKRDAEAEPEAFYGYAGLGYGYGGYHYALAAL